MGKFVRGFIWTSMKVAIRAVVKVAILRTLDKVWKDKVWKENGPLSTRQPRHP